MHQIPCANCQFFTRDYHLKCTVHPAQALTEEAIGCGDFETYG
jgi:RNA polymerase subunit RPABC4/transcription elongation factor Spt4